MKVHVSVSLTSLIIGALLGCDGGNKIVNNEGKKDSYGQQHELIMGILGQNLRYVFFEVLKLSDGSGTIPGKGGGGVDVAAGEWFFDNYSTEEGYIFNSVGRWAVVDDPTKLPPVERDTWNLEIDVSATNNDSTMAIVFPAFLVSQGEYDALPADERGSIQYYSRNEEGFQESVDFETYQMLDPDQMGDLNYSRRQYFRLRLNCTLESTEGNLSSTGTITFIDCDYRNNSSCEETVYDTDILFD